MGNYASICILSYERLDFLQKTMESLMSVDSGYPMEIIVHDDGSNVLVKNYLYKLARDKKISFLIQNAGKNLGIGEAVRKCFKVASGKYLFKLDTDLEFKENWLKEAVEILEKPQIGSVSLLDYNNYNREDDRFKTIQVLESNGLKYKIVTDFISCLYGVKREVYDLYKDHLDTDGWHQHIKSQGYYLAISNEDKIVNFGFGADTSIYLEKKEDGSVTTRKTYDEPLIF